MRSSRRQPHRPRPFVSGAVVEYRRYAAAIPSDEATVPHARVGGEVGSFVPMLRDERPHRGDRRHAAGAGAFTDDADRSAPDLRRPGRHRDRERAAVHGAAGAQSRPNGIARPANGDRRDSPSDQPGPDRRAARLRGHRGQRHAAPRGLGHSGDPIRWRTGQPGGRARRFAGECRRRQGPAPATPPTHPSPGAISAHEESASRRRRRDGPLVQFRVPAPRGREGLPFVRLGADAPWQRSPRHHHRESGATRRVLYGRDRAAPDVCRPGRDCGRERTAVHRAPDEQPRADLGAGHADRHQ